MTAYEKLLYKAAFKRLPRRGKRHTLALLHEGVRKEDLCDSKRHTAHHPQ